MTAQTRDRAGIAWLGALDFAAVAGSLALACMTPFTGLAVAAALTLSRGAGMATVGIAWLLNQIIGYGLLGYPTDPATVMRGIAILLAAGAAFEVGRLGRSTDGSIGVVPAVVAFVGAFAAYEMVNYAGAMLLGGTENFTIEIMWMIGRNDALWFAGLMALHQLLTARVPALFGRRPEMKLA